MLASATPSTSLTKHSQSSYNKDNQMKIATAITKNKIVNKPNYFACLHSFYNSWLGPW